jgi:hypothetical protein
MGNSGIFTVIPKLNDPSHTSFWEISDLWANQLQPIQVLQLSRNLNVDINLFALLNDKHSLGDVETMRAKLFNVTLEVDKSIVLDKSIIGNDVHKLHRAMCAFGLTTAVLFMLKPDICRELKAAIARCFEWIQLQTIHGPTSDLTGLQLVIVGNHLTHAVNKVILDVVGEITKTEEGVKLALLGIPDVGPLSRLTSDILRISLQTTGTVPSGSPEPLAARTKPDGSAVSRSPKLVTTKPICGFYNSTVGCKMHKGGCKRRHNKPKSDEDVKLLDDFFNSKVGQGLVRKG